MKKIAFAFAAVAAALSFASCNKAETPAETPEQNEKQPIHFNITVADPDPATKAVKSGWVAGDIINIWFDSNISQTPDMTLTYDGASWVASAVAQEVVSNLQASGKLKFFWEGTNNLSGWTYNEGYFTPAGGMPRVLYPHWYADNNKYTFDAATQTLTANLQWCYGTNFHIVVEGLDPEDGYQLKYDEGAPFYGVSRIGVNASSVFCPTGSVNASGVANEDGVAFNMYLESAGEKTFTFTLIDSEGAEHVLSTTKTITFAKTRPEDNFFAVKLPALNSGRWEIKSSNFTEKLEEGYFTYYGVDYNVVKMKDGKWWMAQNLAYLPEGYTPATDLTAVTAGVFAPLQVNADQTAAEFTTDPAVVATNGYLYQAEVALGLKVGDLKSVAEAEALEGAQGICPQGWHVPTLADIMGLVGKCSGETTQADAPYYSGADGLIKLLNEDGFNMDAFGAISIQDNTKTNGTFMGFMASYKDHLSSGMFCGSTYAGVTYNTSGDETSGVKNLQVYGLMPMTNKSSADQYTCNGTKVSYRIAGPVRCVRN